MANALILAVVWALLSLGCAHRPKLNSFASSSYPVEELAAIEAIYRHLFDHNYSAMQKRAKAYCLSIVEANLELEPDKDFLARFADVQIPIHGRSRFRPGLDLIFQVSAITKIDSGLYRIEAGYYEGPVSGSRTVFDVRLINGKWHVSKDPDALELISKRANKAPEPTTTAVTPRAPASVFE